MEHLKYKPQNKNNEFFEYMKYFLFGYNFLIFLCGLVLLAIGIWLGVDRNFMTTIIGNNLYAASVFMILAGGGCIFFIVFFGCCGVIKENKFMIQVYAIVLLLVSVVLIIGGICAIAFRVQIRNSIKDTMSSTLTTYYGVNFQNEYNRAVTDAWDIAQERLKCCAVSNHGWYLYRNTTWFSRFGAHTGLQITYEEGTERPYVPISCCVKDIFWRYINKEVCQTWRLGPPGSPVDGAENRAIYYDGCYEAGYNYLTGNSNILIGLGIVIGIFAIVGIILAIFLLIKLRD